MPGIMASRIRERSLDLGWSIGAYVRELIRVDLDGSRPSHDALIVRSKQMTENMRPMRDFNPSKSAEVYDELNDVWFEWKPEWAKSWREFATPNEPDGSTMLWDGDIIAGWRPLRKGKARS